MRRVRYDWERRKWVEPDGTRWHFYRSPYERHWVRSHARWGWTVTPD